VSHRFALLITTGISFTVLAGSLVQAGTASRASLPILVYHQIRTSGTEPADDLTAISLERFRSHMRFLKTEGYRTLSMNEVIAFMHGETFAEKVVAVHLDDGWKSGLAAIPVLNDLNFKASFWIIAGTGIGLPHVDWSDVDAIAANPRFDVFSHTMTHPWKPNDTLPDWLAGRTPGKGAAQAAWELGESKRVLETHLGRPVPYLAWPAGHYTDTLVDMAQAAGYRALLTIDDGVNAPGGSLLRIHRTMVHGSCDIDDLRQILNDGVSRDCSQRVTTGREDR